MGRTGTRTDTIILFSVIPETGDGAMFSVPRNLTEAPLPEGMGVWDCNCFPDILTHLWANAEWFPEAFPGPQEPSVNALKAAVGRIFDVEVDYYAKVDLAQFVGLFDALGGVLIDAPVRIYESIGSMPGTAWMLKSGSMTGCLKMKIRKQTSRTLSKT